MLLAVDERQRTEAFAEEGVLLLVTRLLEERAKVDEDGELPELPLIRGQERRDCVQVEALRIRVLLGEPRAASARVERGR